MGTRVTLCCVCGGEAPFEERRGRSDYYRCEECGHVTSLPAKDPEPEEEID